MNLSFFHAYFKANWGITVSPDNKQIYYKPLTQIIKKYLDRQSHMGYINKAPNPGASGPEKKEKRILKKVLTNKRASGNIKRLSQRSDFTPRGEEMNVEN